MKFVKIIGIFLTLVALTKAEFNSHNASHNRTCIDLSNDEKEEIFKEYDSLFRQYMNDVIYARGSTKDPYKYKVDVDLYRDKVNCSNISRSHTNLANSYCPWWYKTKVRASTALGFKYPKYRQEVQCVCDHCNKDERGEYRCTPVLQPMTCLERKECGRNGFYKWVPSIEMINVACVCSRVK